MFMAAGSGGCIDGAYCLWKFVSDILDGVSGGASGYAKCMTAVPEVNLAAAMPNVNATRSCTVALA